MVEYKCFECGKTIPPELIRKRVRCPYCSSKIFFKKKNNIVKIKAK